jgi:hypothetical protein
MAAGREGVEGRKLEQIIGNLVIQEGETDEASIYPSTAYRKWFVG